jgi:hypothetical protein
MGVLRRTVGSEPVSNGPTEAGPQKFRKSALKPTKSLTRINLCGTGGAASSTRQIEALQAHFHFPG